MDISLRTRHRPPPLIASFTPDYIAKALNLPSDKITLLRDLEERNGTLHLSPREDW
jgi:hypothetical protein